MKLQSLKFIVPMLILVALVGVHSVFAADLATLRQAAEQGDAAAQYELGVLYLRGEAVPQDLEKGVSFIQSAAEQGAPAAQRTLGLLYARGHGVSADLHDAVFWWKKAAVGGDPKAQYYLGFAYSRDGRIEPNPQEAVSWYLKAAEQGVAEAQYELAQMYASGTGTTEDLNAAIFWYGHAAGGGHVGAQYELGNCYAHGAGVERNMKEAARYYKYAANRGYVEAQYALALLYDSGESVSKDLSSAAGWFQLAAEQGHAGAQYYMGILSAQGSVVPLDMSAAARWFQLSADQGDAGAQFELGSLYARGEGVGKDMEKARSWWQKADAQGFDQAKIALSGSADAWRLANENSQCRLQGPLPEKLPRLLVDQCQVKKDWMNHKYDGMYIFTPGCSGFSSGRYVNIDLSVDQYRCIKSAGEYRLEADPSPDYAFVETARINMETFLEETYLIELFREQSRIALYRGEDLITSSQTIENKAHQKTSIQLDLLNILSLAEQRALKEGKALDLQLKLVKQSEEKRAVEGKPLKFYRDFEGMEYLYDLSVKMAGNRFETEITAQ